MGTQPTTSSHLFGGENEVPKGKAKKNNFFILKAIFGATTGGEPVLCAPPPSLHFPWVAPRENQHKMQLGAMLHAEATVSGICWRGALLLGAPASHPAKKTDAVLPRAYERLRICNAILNVLDGWTVIIHRFQEPPVCQQCQYICGWSCD